MMKNWKLCLLFLAAMALQNTAVQAEDLPMGKQVPQSLELSKYTTLHYWLYLPEDYTPEKKYPLVLFLHGRGERGDNLEAVLKHGPPKQVAAGEKFPFILVSPQLPLTHLFWQTEDLVQLLDHLETTYSVDADRVYCTGLSMGGFATWALGVFQPERFAALIPICGQGDPSVAPTLKHLPIWVFHGTEDKAVPFEHSQRMVDALKKAGGNVKFTVYPKVGHDSWTATYNNPEVYEWMLQQKRGQ